jgi:hypothetical protein
MKEAKFTITPILFIVTMILGIIICYFTGKLFMDITNMDTTNMNFIIKGITVLLGGFIWVGVFMVFLIGLKLYESFKEIFFN